MSASREEILKEFDRRITKLLKLIEQGIDVESSPPLSKKCEKAAILIPGQSGQTLLRVSWGILRKCQAFRSRMHNILFPTLGKFAELVKYLFAVDKLLTEANWRLSDFDVKTYAVFKEIKELLQWLRVDSVSDRGPYQFSETKLSPVIADFREAVHIGTILKVIKPFWPDLPADFSITAYLDHANTGALSLNLDMGIFFNFICENIQRYEQGAEKETKEVKERHTSMNYSPMLLKKGMSGQSAESKEKDSPSSVPMPRSS